MSPVHRPRAAAVVLQWDWSELPTKVRADHNNATQARKYVVKFGIEKSVRIWIDGIMKVTQQVQLA